MKEGREILCVDDPLVFRLYTVSLDGYLDPTPPFPQNQVLRLLLFVIRRNFARRDRFIAIIAVVTLDNRNPMR